jgi:tetratricopeptide (TPR) repeat protein
VVIKPSHEREDPGERLRLGPVYGRSVVFLHLDGPPPAEGPAAVDTGAPLGTIAGRPAIESARFQAELERADRLYAEGRYADAATLLLPLASGEPDNPFLLDRLGRSLFWIADDESQLLALKVYRRLIGLLDASVTVESGTVVVDLWFREAYWKVSSLYLDHGAWEAAVYEITRARLAGVDAEPAVRDQALCFLLEAHLELGNIEAAAYFRDRALEANPANACVKKLLDRKTVL